jgi:hypothetical protein
MREFVPVYSEEKASAMAKRRLKKSSGCVGSVKYLRIPSYSFCQINSPV